MASARAMAAPLISLEDIMLRQGDGLLFEGLSLFIGARDRLALIGRNGAGKTTLLRLCAGRIPLARGEGTVLGCDLLTERRHLRPLVGVLGHRNGLYLDLTVSENVQFWASVVGADAAEVATVLDRLGLSGRLAALPARRLSAGQMRRTAFACFVVRRAHLWLLDEPHTGLDATARDEIDDIIRQASTFGVTVILASHELERASALATRTVELAGGVVTADFDPRAEAFG